MPRRLKTVCISAAEHENDPEDQQFEWRKGYVVVPSGTVFDYVGHLPSGSNLQHPDGGEDFSIDPKHTIGVITTKDVRLTAAKPCALTTARTVLSPTWGWTIPSIIEDGSSYYYVYGVIRRGALDTNFTNDDVLIDQFAARGELHSSVRGTISKPLQLDEWSASQPPDDAPVSGKGNSECWGDDERHDISCRALTEHFLMSMRGATKAEVVKAMNAQGREIPGGLHFLSNYSRGERWGPGDVNFRFNDSGRVHEIDASLDPPNEKGSFAGFIWNAERLPQGCSDLPGSKMRPCKDL